MHRVAGIFLVSFCLGAQVDPGYVIPQQNPYTSPADLQRGEQLFLGQCGRCHGPKGGGGIGAILAQPRLRHAPDDQSLFSVIREGVRGTEMPAGSTLSTREVWQLAAFVRSLGRVPTEVIAGDPQRGQQVYQKGKCAQCHIANGQGTSVGPELSDVGARRSATYIRTSMVDPSADVPDRFAQLRITTKDGRRITGVRLAEDTFTIQLVDLSGRSHSFFKQELTDIKKDFDKSPMPGYRDLLSASELDDLVAYLVSLPGNL